MKKIFNASTMPVGNYAKRHISNISINMLGSFAISNPLFKAITAAVGEFEVNMVQDTDNPRHLYLEPVPAGQGGFKARQTSNGSFRWYNKPTADIIRKQFNAEADETLIFTVIKNMVPEGDFIGCYPILTDTMVRLKKVQRKPKL